MYKLKKNACGCNNQYVKKKLFEAQNKKLFLKVIELYHFALHVHVHDVSG